MASAALAPGAGKDALRAPKPLLLWAIVLVACAAAAVSVGLTLTNDQRGSRPCGPSSRTGSRSPTLPPGWWPGGAGPGRGLVR
jgi:hypothetical protein